MWSRLSILCAAGLAVVVGAACEPGEEVRHVSDPYVGAAPYPNRRAKIVLPSGEVGLVSNSLSDALTYLALPEARVIATVPIGRDPVDIDGPHHLAVDRAHGVVVTAFSYPPPAAAPGPHASHGTSDRFGFLQKLALDDLHVLGEVRLDPNPGDVVMSEDGARIVVTHYDVKRGLSGKTLDEQRANVMLVDANALSLPSSPDPKSVRVCVAPHGASLSHGDGSTAYVACYGEDSLAIVDLAAPDLAIERFPLAGGTTHPGSAALGPYSATLSPDGSVLAVGCLLSREVRVFDVPTKTFRAAPLPVAGAAMFSAWSADGRTLFVPVQTPDALVAFDMTPGAPTYGSPIRQRPFGAECDKPHEVVRGAAGGSLYVVCEGDHTGPGAVVVLDAQTFELTARAEVGVYPDRVALFAGAP
jgi:DNA-binding beta-propeller fold protein YncE